jgi:hypothetical protein
MSMDPVDLERLIDRELQALPTPRAPHTLLPRVLAAAERLAMRPWYSRAWFTWPRPLQGAFAAVLLLGVGLASAALWLPMGEVVRELGWWPGTPALTEVVAIPRWLSAPWDASRIVWRVLVEPVIGYLVMFVLVMSGACVAFGTALDRVALGGVSEI